MNFFTIIPDAQSIIYTNGVYRQTALYLRGDKLYAKYGAGFVRISQGGATSHPKIRWAELDGGHGQIDDKRFGDPVYIAPANDAVAA